MSIYVSMHDSFMSGWGCAEGKENVYQIECDNFEQVVQIMRSARKRNEMRDFYVDGPKRKSNEKILVTNVHFNDLGQIWTGNVEKTA